MTAEQLESSRAERMRQNGHGALTLEDARTWMEETGLCPFSPRRQFATFTAPSFVEAVAGHRDQNPSAKQTAEAESLLVRLERDDVAIRLNLLGQPGEQADYIVAAWVLPYVYALRGDRDWRRIPQLTGSRQVSPLAVEAYKLLEGGDATIPQLKHGLGREVSESAVLRAVTELWQQLRIIPVISAPGETIRWQLLRTRFQKAIAEGASTSQVTAISVLASIYLQAVIAASMEEVELFLSPLTARSKVREVLRGLVATRQVHTIQFGHAPHFYVAGTLPEFAPPPTAYTSAAMASSSYFAERYEEAPEPVTPAPERVAENRQRRAPAPHKPVANGKPAAHHFSRPAAHARDRKPAQGASASRTARRPGADARKASSRATTTRHHGNSSGNGARSSRPSGGSIARDRNSSHSWAKRNGHGGKPAGGTAAHRSKSGKPDARGRKPVLAAGTKAGNSRQYGFRAAAKQGTKKRG